MTINQIGIIQLAIIQNSLDATLTFSFGACFEIMHSENNPICAFEYNSVALISIHQILLDKSNLSFLK